MQIGSSAQVSTLVPEQRSNAPNATAPPDAPKASQGDTNKPAAQQAPVQSAQAVSSSPPTAGTDDTDSKSGLVDIFV
ncbi:MAG: hypothetical protein ACE5Q3_07415 [Alphaproteobacteria bacterium]